MAAMAATLFLMVDAKNTIFMRNGFEKKRGAFASIKNVTGWHGELKQF